MNTAAAENSVKKCGKTGKYCCQFRIDMLWL